MTVLITRPLADSLLMKKQLDKLCIQSFIEPLLDISISPQDKSINFDKFEAFIFTSKNAASFLSLYDLELLKHKQCFAIGEITKNALIDLGFYNIYQCDNKIMKLAETIISYPHLNGKILYFRGQTIRHDLKKILQQENFICDEKICYKISAAQSFSPQLLDMIQKKEIKSVILCSYETSKTFFRLCNNYNVANCFKESKIIVIGVELYNELRRSNTENVILYNGDIASLSELVK